MVRHWFPAMVTIAALVPGAARAEPAAKCTGPAGCFSARAGGEDFRILAESDPVNAGELLVALPGAALESANRAVRAQSLADFDGRSDHPVFETAFTLNEAKDADLDVTLDRGRLALTNARTEGAATVRVRFRDQSWKVTLDAPGTRVAFEVFGRWPPGTRFKVIGPKDTPPAPFASFTLTVLGGTAAADVGGLTLGLKPPPGPARLEWDSVAGTSPQPVKVEKLPEWADANAAPSADARKVAEAVEKFRALRVTKPGGAVEQFLAAADPVEQRIGLIAVAAADDLDRLARLIGGAKTPADWDFGTTVARHWLGRCAGQDQKLFAALTTPLHGYTPAQAKVILQLLLGFDPADAGRPETYEVLIEYLSHDKSAIRNLAAWHLVRLVPQGPAVGYNPVWTKAECQPAYAAWKKLIPAGQLPPKKP